MPIEDAYIPPQASRPTGKKEMNSHFRTKKRVAKANSPTVNSVTEDNPKQDMPNFIIHNGVRHYWTTVEVPTVVHISK